tara:strand:+ start:45 stop:419 length:375 start_codon:yes stop_codon:yes gene_type:complete
MAHFARLDENNIVLQVIVVANEDTADADGNEVEAIGAQFCHDLLGGEWVQTSYNSNFRGCHPSAGFTYDPNSDTFIPPPSPGPYPSWTWDADDAAWKPPVVYPGVVGEEPFYYWNEESGSWNLQ